LVIWVRSLWGSPLDPIFSEHAMVLIEKGAIVASGCEREQAAGSEQGVVLAMSHTRGNCGIIMPKIAYRNTQEFGYVWGVILPFWLLLLITAIPTAWLWRRDRRLISCSPDHLFCVRCGC